MNNNDILKIFYEEIIPAASTTGVIEIDGINYHIGFNTMIDGKKTTINDNSLPMLMINDIDIFNDLLLKYSNDAMENFSDKEYDYVKEMVCGFELKNQIKYLLTVLFSNAREEDFKNPMSYLKLRLDFLHNKQLASKYSEYIDVANIEKLDDSKIQVLSKKQNPFLETPYVFSSRICKDIDNEINYYQLPNISYGISDDKIYIYTIQGEHKDKKVQSKYEKKINRLLYKINDNVVADSEYLEYKNNPRNSYYPENIIDVTHSSVIALSIFLKVLQNEGYKDIVVVDYLPFRYISKTNKILSIVDKKIKENKYDDMKKLYHQLLDHDYDQSNMTDKFIRTFRRVNYHLDNMNIIAYPNEIDNSMHIKLKDASIESDNLVNVVYNSINSSNNKTR